MLSVQHRFNPLHVYCRLVDRGLNKRFSLSVCRYYEILIYSWLAWFTILAVRVCKLTHERIIMKMLLLLLSAVALVLGVAGLAKAIPIQFTDVTYSTTSEVATMLLVGLGVIGFIGFGRMSSGKPLPSEANQKRAVAQDNGGRRSRYERRQLSCTFCMPERRSDEDRRSRADRRKSKRTIYAH